MTNPTSATDKTSESPRNEGPGGVIGRYKLLQQIGEGGFGSVFEAEQEQPVRRRVALKIIKLGMDTNDVIARFEAERQALALMDHPNIARVLDAGATSTGRPYFVMELVKGDPISRYCDKNNLSITDRLRLFEQICQAVQHAHTKGIIHRDIKPSNVLVSTVGDQPAAKVIDFGIAKAVSGRLTDRTFFTEQNQMIGTPLYMSPEQAEGSADIDTRTDIYSLGVLLYELLTGTTPFESATLRSAAYAEMQRIIREVDPPCPSTRLAQSRDTITGVAQHRCTEPRKLTSVIRGELDWIVMKALDKNRARRYETANGFAADVRRYLDGQPVQAAPPSGIYQFQKFVKRNRFSVAAAAAVAFALVLGVGGIIWQARITSQRAAELQQVATFQAKMLAQVDVTAAGKLLTTDFVERLDAALLKAGVPDAERAAQVETFTGLWQQVSATDAASALIDSTILKPAVIAIDKQFKDQPSVDAALTQSLADLYLGMGLLESALPLQERALRLRQTVLGSEHPDTLTSTNNLGEIFHYLGELDKAEPFYRDTLEKRRRLLGAEHPDTLASIANMGALLHAQGKLDEAEVFYREALDKRRRILGEDAPGTLDSTANLGRLLQDKGDLAAAEPLFREALEKKRRVLGQEHPETLTSISNMGSLLRTMGKLDEAEPFYREALAKYRAVLGEEHPETLTSIGNMGTLLRTQGKLDEAEPFFREAWDKRRASLGDDHPNTLISLANMGNLWQAQGKNAEAVALLTPAEPALRATFPDANAFRLAKFLMSLGKARAGLGEYAAAEANLLESDAIYTVTPGPAVNDTLECKKAIIDLYAAMELAEPGKGFGARSLEWQQKLDNPSSASAAPTPVAPTPVAPTPVAPTPVAPTPVAPTPSTPPVTTTLPDKAVTASEAPVTQPPQANSLEGVSEIAPARPTTALVTGVLFRSEPDVSAHWLGTKTIAGELFMANAQRGASKSCDNGWLRVTRAGNFTDAASANSAVISEVWICQGNVGQTWIK